MADKKPKAVKRVHVSAVETFLFHELKKQIPTIKHKKVYGFFPIDKSDCECASVIQDIKNKLSLLNEQKQRDLKYEMEVLRCPRDKSGMSKFKISCNNCGADLAECWATDETLVDYCDLHYISYHDGEYWQGALGVNISPIDLKIGFECCCGEDTRDFRLKTNVPDDVKKEKEKNLQGREFGKKDSKFKSEKVN